MITGRIKQIETMGLVDGPGIRVVVFMQGCPLRCLFCHNPEMWEKDGGQSYTPQQVLDLVLKYKNYFGEQGGVTFSGGEPHMQPEFLRECLKLCKEAGINTCIDTSGVGDDKFFDQILEYVDLVIMSIKGVTSKQYTEIASGSIESSQRFLQRCQDLNMKLWLRNVIVLGINDNDNFILELANYLKDIKNIERIELLPYHTMGVSKYTDLGLAYRLENTPAMDVTRCRELELKLLEMLKK
jgi:pyruvate formate lyase activating enzyme